MWLEEFLAKHPAAMIVVSHDRYFLDKVTNRTLELFRGTVDGYSGNYSAYWRQKAERLLVQRRAYEKQQHEIAKAEQFIRRHHYGQKHAQAEDRRKKLERIVRVEQPREIAAPAMGFPRAERSGDVVVRAHQIAKSYDHPLFARLSFELARGQRWGILGPNGSGKTTLLRCILGQEPPDCGQVTLGQGVVVGYFDQHLSAMDDELPAVDAIRPDHKEFDEPKRRNLLARFGLTGDTALQKIGRLSGGERCRAALARLAARDANFLVLDEPTNHLDLWARDALEQSLMEFDGTVLFVSHDRYFVNRVTDHLLVVEPGRFRVVEGNYDTYLSLVESGLAAGAAGSKPAARPAQPRQERAAPREKGGPGADKPQPRKRRFPYRKIADLEAEILKRETRLEQLHQLLAQPQTHRSADRVRQTKAEIGEQQAVLQNLYAHWEEAVELNW